MRAVIIANGELTQPGAHTGMPLRPGDLLIAADGGARHCLALGLRPDVVIGDMDSLDDSDLSALQAQGAQAIRYPTRKDDTDLELALKYADQQGADEILIIAGLGARWDQTLANILLPARYPHLHISLVDGAQEIHFLHEGLLHLTGKPGDTVSLIPLGNDAQGVSTQGLEYPLHKERLLFGSSRGVSNVLLGERAQVSLEQGLLLCVVIHKM